MHIYGEQIKNNFVNFFLKNRSNLQINGNGEEKRNLLHVDDLFSFIQNTKSQKKNVVVNLATKDNISLNEIIKIIKGNAKYNYNLNDSYPKKISYQKAKRMFKWTPKKKFTKYLKKFV